MRSLYCVFLSGCARESLQFKFLCDFILEIFFEGVDRGKLIHPLIGTAGVDEHAVRSVAARRAFFRRHGGLAHRGPDVFDYIDAAAHITASSDGPDDLAGIGNIDVVVYDHDKFAAISSRTSS